LPFDGEKNFLLMEKLAQKVGELLKRNRQVLVTAESCTGGWAAQAVTSVAGSSGWFERGFVTYSNEAKHELLNVSENTLKNHGAVSEQTAREMALGALGQSRGTVAVAITGVAGPAGGSKEKPVGTVCFAWAGKGAAVRSETRHFTGDRESVRRQSVVRALEGVIESLEEKGLEG
jgi:nicotinamide-nucleotide amidase